MHPNTHQIFDIRDRLALNFRRVDAILDRLESGLDTDAGAAVNRLKIEAVAEIRQNMALAQKVAESVYNTEAASRFEQIVIDLLAQQSPHIRKQLIGKLNEARNNARPTRPDPEQPARGPKVPPAR